MQGFDEIKDSANMTCKRINKNFKSLKHDFYEYISDIQAYKNMFPVHKISKFGKSTSKKGSKIFSFGSELFSKDEFKNVDILLSDGRTALVSFQ